MFLNIPWKISVIHFTISSWLAAPIPSVTKHQHLRLTQQLTGNNTHKRRNLGTNEQLFVTNSKLSLQTMT